MTRSGQADNPTKRKFKEKNRPPPGEPFMWLTREMLESPAWRAMPSASRRVLDRVMIEHMMHAGTQNGELPCTYDNFVDYGVRRSSIKPAISIAVALGFLDLVVRGIPGHGIARRPHVFGLTWIPRADWTPASNRWKAVDKVAAEVIVELYAQSHKRNRLVTESGLDKPRTLHAVAR